MKAFFFSSPFPLDLHNQKSQIIQNCCLLRFRNKKNISITSVKALNAFHLQLHFIPRRYCEISRKFRNDTDNWVIRRQKTLAHSPPSQTHRRGDSCCCCVLTRIYFMAHRCIITHLMYQQFLFLQPKTLVLISCFSRSSETVLQRDESMIRYTHLHFAQSNIHFFFFLSPSRFQLLCAELTANVFWNSEECRWNVINFHDSTVSADAAEMCCSANINFYTRYFLSLHRFDFQVFFQHRF